MKIAIGADHRGHAMKDYLIAHAPVNWLDVGSFTQERVDYPEYADLVCRALLSGEVKYGVLICGSGIGMAMAANRFPGIYAALCWCPEVAMIAKQDDGSNVLVLPSDFVSCAEALAIFQAWLNADFKGGRYQVRLDMLNSLDR